MLKLLRATLQKLFDHGAFVVCKAGTQNNQKDGQLDCLTRATRRSVLYTLGATVMGSAEATTGASGKQHLREFGKTFAYLKDPGLRAKETGNSLLTINNAEFSGVSFQGLTWKSIRFVNCDFVGAYEIKLSAMQDCVFENCKLVGIHDFGVMNRVKFYKCLSGSNSNWGGQVNSKHVVFDGCQFIGSDPDRNHQGAIGTYGEASFISCKVKWFDLVGDTGITITGCELEDVACHPDVDGLGAHVLIELCKLQGAFCLTPANLLSLTIRDTVMENLDLSDTTVKGDILIERVKGGYINAYVKQAKRLQIRDSQIHGNGKKIFEAFAGGIGEIDIDKVTFGGDVSTEPVTIAGGTGLDLENVRARISNSFSMRNSKVPRLSTHHMNTAAYALQNCQVDSLDLTNSRIDKVELTGNTIARGVDFTNTQVKESKVQPLAKGQAKLDGSNIKA